LKLFESSHCSYVVHGDNISLTIFVQDKQTGMPVVFDNFVWTTRDELLSRLKRELPLFMPELPESSGLTKDIIRVLEQVAIEHGLKAPVLYDSSFWTLRGMNVFFIEGISTPVASLQIEGENRPSPEEVLRWSQAYTKENFSAARLTWVTDWLIRDLYAPRGYLNAVVGQPILQCLGEKEDTYPVRVILPVSSGNLYTFGSVQFEGLSKPHAAYLLSKWKLKPGDPFDAAYENKFISDEILRAPWAAHSNAESDIGILCRTIDAATSRVSLLVNVSAPKRAYAPMKEGQGCVEMNAVSLGH
jgi:hypothetical protein